MVHVLDASRAVGVATTLVSETIRDDYVAKIAAEYEQVRAARAGRGQSELVPLDKARDNAFDADMSLKPPARRGCRGVHDFPDWDLKPICAPISTGRRSSAPGSWRATIPRSSTTTWSAKARARCSPTRRRCSTR